MQIYIYWVFNVWMNRSDYDSLSHIKDHQHRVYAAMILALDRSVGRVLEAVKNAGIENDTMIVFTSDNGGANYVNIKVISSVFTDLHNSALLDPFIGY